MQINVAAVDDAIVRIHGVRKVDTLDASISKAEVLALHNRGEHLLFDSSHEFVV
jgi:hypothetical protein